MFIEKYENSCFKSLVVEFSYAFVIMGLSESLVGILHIYTIQYLKSQ